MVSTSTSRDGTLEFFLQRNSNVRRPDPARRKPGTDSYRKYKKGWELRIVVDSAAELARLRRLLRHAGHPPAKAFRKRLKWVQPVYGRDAVLDLTARQRA